MPQSTSGEARVSWLSTRPKGRPPGTGPHVSAGHNRGSDAIHSNPSPWRIGLNRLDSISPPTSTWKRNTGGSPRRKKVGESNPTPNQYICIYTLSLSRARACPRHLAYIRNMCCITTQGVTHTCIHICRCVHYSSSSTAPSEWPHSVSKGTRERELFIGSQCSNLYTSVDTPAKGRVGKRDAQSFPVGS